MSTEIRVFAHARGNVYMRQIAELLIGEIQLLGIEARLVTQGVPGGARTLDIVIAPHEYTLLEPGLTSERAIEAMSRCVAVTTEQPGTPWFEANVRLCQQCPVIVDISPVASDHLVAWGLASEPLGIGYTSLWDRWGGREPWSRNTDITMMAAITPHRARALAALAPVLAERRSRVLLFDNTRPVLDDDRWFVAGESLWGLLCDSRVLLNVRRDERRGYFEWIRCLPAVLNGALVVTEPSAGTEPLVPFEHLVAVEWPLMGAHLTALLDDEDLRARMARAAYEAVRSSPPMSASVRRLVERGFDALALPVPASLGTHPTLASTSVPSGPAERTEPVCPSPVPGHTGGPANAVSEVVVDAAGHDGTPDLAALAHEVEAATTPFVLIRGSGDRLAPRALAALYGALIDESQSTPATTAYGPTVAGHTVVNHLPWDPSRLCRSAFLGVPVLVRRATFADALRSAAAALERHPETSAAWCWQLPFLILAARGHRSEHVPVVIGWTDVPTTSEPAPTWMSRSLPSLPWPVRESEREDDT